MDNLEICLNCGSKCCKSTPPALTGRDIKRISQISPPHNWLETVNGAPVIKKKETSNSCYFLDESGKCVVYDKRPLDCVLFPLLLKVKSIEDNRYELEWRIWYCPLTNSIEISYLLANARKIIYKIMKENIDDIFEYQEAMKRSGGYKRKHFLLKETVKV